ncbi:MAG: multicopper oxidase family protein [Rhodospirillaceae bacterium]|nr:MAG: multicopper oxidase family protein [Rhodospirillaceae bacterium]
MSRIVSRRQFLAYSSAAAAVAGTAGILPLTRAAADTSAPTDLRIVQRNLEVLGKPAKVFGIVRANGQPGLFLQPDERFNVNLLNQVGEDAVIHWHGMTPPYLQDGVADSKRPLIVPGKSAAYDFVPQPGTHWMHSHHGLQEQLLMAAPLIVRTKEDVAADVQEVTVLLHDFTFKNPVDVLNGLTKGSTSAASHDMSMPGMDMSGGGNMNMPGMDMSGGSTMKMESGQTMSPADSMQMDLNDVNYDAYLANDRTLEDPEVVRVERNGRVRLRLINGATSTAFYLHFLDLSGDLIAVDGNPIKPVNIKRIGVSMGQRIDVLITLPRSGSFPILAQREGDTARTGIILASPGASVGKVDSVASRKSETLDLSLEATLRPLQPLSARAADVTHKIQLTGSMQPYVWSIDGLTWENHRPLKVSEGQRVVVEMVNQTMMAHPMHLHGHHFQVIGINGVPVNGAVRDTVLVPAMASVSVAFDAHNPGRWPLHCHNLLHMATGMMTEVVYDQYA